MIVMRAMIFALAAVLQFGLLMLAGNIGAGHLALGLLPFLVPGSAIVFFIVAVAVGDPK